MKFFNKLIFPVFAGVFLMVALTSCEEDLTSVGAGVVGVNPFSTNKETFKVFAQNKKIEAIETNKLPVYQLGKFIDPVYGKTEAKIISQVQLSTLNPRFGANSQSSEDDAFDEKEKVTSVELYIPYLINGVVDLNGDGVIDATDAAEGTEPREFDLDSIFFNVPTTSFNLKVAESTYFLRDLDPEANFEEAQEYYSDQPFSSSFFTNVLFDSTVNISAKETLIFNDDDADTEVDESTTVKSRILPGITVALDTVVFNNILKMEGKSELSSQADFVNFFRGIHLSVDSDVLLLLDIKQARITMEYEYISEVDDNGTEADTSDDVITKEDSSYVFNLLTGGVRVQNGTVTPVVGNAVNILENDPYAIEISNSYTEANASRIYLKGGAGSYAEIKLFDDATDGANIISDIKANNWIINEANIVFHVDRDELNTSSIEPLRLYLFNAETNVPLYNVLIDASNTNQFSSFLNYDGILEKNASGEGVKYTIRITDYINNIIEGNIENVPLGLSVTSDINSSAISNTMVGGEEVSLPLMSSINPLGTVLFGSADDETKLELEISYTIVN